MSYAPQPYDPNNRLARKPSYPLIVLDTVYELRQMGIGQTSVARQIHTGINPDYEDDLIERLYDRGHNGPDILEALQDFERGKYSMSHTYASKIGRGKVNIYAS